MAKSSLVVQLCYEDSQNTDEEYEVQAERDADRNSYKQLVTRLNPASEKKIRRKHLCIPSFLLDE